MHQTSWFICQKIPLVGCFSKTLFQKKIRAIPSRTPLGSMKSITKSFFCLEKSRRSNHLVKNGGLLQCRFSLSRHLDRPRVGLSENLHCKSPPFLTKWFDLLDLSKQKKLLDMLYIDTRGAREGIALIFF